MLDLNFVRDNLPLVEEKLRQRGMKPSEVLKNFAQVDAQRRQAITSAETMKAQRNRASEEIAKLKKSGQDASTLIAETKKREKLIAGLTDYLSLSGELANTSDVVSPPGLLITTSATAISW